MKKLYSYMVMALLMCFAIDSFAQRTITGMVMSTSKEALISANVQVQGTKTIAVTDADGKYSIVVPAGSTALVFSYVGYDTQTVTIGESNSIDIQLAEGGALSTLHVIGSRDASRTKLESPVPVDVIPVKNIVNEVGQLDLNQILTYIAPSFQSARQAIADGTDHVDPASLRGMGTDQVLVLVNGKRRHQSALVNVNGTVNRGQVGTDLSAIPASSIERIEILRDGAAAQYGSDAIAGVINIVLKENTGLSASASFGENITKYNKNKAQFFPVDPATGLSKDPFVTVQDGKNIQVGLNYGLKIGKGHLNIGVEYLDRGATNRTGTYTGQIYPLQNGKNRDDSIMTAKGYTRNTFDMEIGSSAVKGVGSVVNFKMPINDNLEIYAFGGYNTKKGLGAGFYRYPNAIWTAAGNANWTGVRAKVLANYPDGFLPRIGSTVTDLSFAAGARGKVKDWNYDVSATYGKNDFAFDVSNSISYSQVAVSPDAPAQTIFKAGKSAFSQITLNGDVSRKYAVLEGLNVAAGAEYRIDGYEIVAGEEASYKNYDTKFGVAAGSQVFQGFLPANAGKNTRNSVGAYLDIEQDFSKNFMVGAAIRFENYSDFGATTNYKVVSRYKFSDMISIRGAVSTGFRAPSMQQRFYSKTNTVFISQGGNLVPAESGTFTNESSIADLLGIPKLKQETSQNYSLGFTARLNEYMEWTLDGYQINVKDRIVLTNNFGAGSDPALGTQLNAAGATTANVFTNAVDTRSRGIESVLSWRRSYGKQTWGFTGAITFINNHVMREYEVLGNGVDKPYVKASDVLVRTGQIGNYFNREDQSRLEVAMPRTKASVTVNYKNGAFGVMLRNTYFGEVTYLDPSVNPNDYNTFPSDRFSVGSRVTLDQTFAPKVVTDLTFSYTIAKKATIAIGANNLLDVYSDEHAHWNNMSLGRFVYSRRVQQMGFNGRYVFARLSYTL
jgi:iron complex outermembrane recepter protein